MSEADTTNHTINGRTAAEYKASFIEWQKENVPDGTEKIPEQKELWNESRTLCKEVEESEGFDEADPYEIHTVVAGVADEKFKGTISGQKKKDLKRAYEALLFGNIHSRKKSKFEIEYNRRFEEGHKLEISELEAEKDRINQQNQTLAHNTHLARNTVKAKNSDLQKMALRTAAIQYAKEKGVAVELFHKKGFGISRAILTKSTKEIKKAGDFGPNSAVAGRPFFKGFFKELSKGRGSKKMDALADVKNSDLIYTDQIDKTVANDRNSGLSGHPLDTPENRRWVWYGSDTKNSADGVASAIVMKFNSTRSDVMSKELRPGIGMSNSHHIFYAQLPLHLTYFLTLQ